jgi:hypothetical protein
MNNHILAVLPLFKKMVSRRPIPKMAVLRTCELLEIRLGVSGVVEHEEKLDMEEQLPFLHQVRTGHGKEHII